MKATREGLTVPELKRRVGAGEVAPLYLIVGEDGWLRDEAVAAIQSAVLGSDEAAVGVFTGDVVYGDETDASEILTLCHNLPMFTARRLVVVRTVEDLRAKDAERLLPYLDAPVETTCLVLAGRKVDGRMKFFQTYQKVAVTVDCAPLEARALPAWIREQAAALELSMDDSTRARLQEAGSGDLGVLRREMEKLAAYVAPRKTVLIADVEAVQGADTGGTVNDFVGALRQKDRGRALRVLAKVLDAGEPPLKILGFLAWHWRQEWKSRRFSDEMLRDFEQFREADSRLKGGGGRGKDRLVMERMTLNLCRGAARATPGPRPFAPAR